MNSLYRGVALFLLGASLSGCATILSGKTQTVTVESNPPGARCEFIREGRVIASIEQTPGAVLLEKTKHDIDVVCKKEGFGESKGFAQSGTEGSTFGNIILGGVIGWGIDSAVGADNKYPERITINLTPQTPTSPAPAAQPMRTVAKAQTDDIRKKLSTLKQLKDEGLLTDNEYESKRKEVMQKL